ncbi:hypothetical protein [Streptomyces sp. NPDC002550]
MQQLRAALASAASAAVIAGSLIAGTAPASADAGPVFTVMNTSETLPDGVWFRNSPHTQDTDRITGLGVYRGEQVRAECYLMGDSVGPYGNRVWYYSDNISRPSAAGRANKGFLNTHYVNDGMTANHVAPGVPPCGGTPGPPAPAGQNVAYYSGKGNAGADLARSLHFGRVLTADGSYDGKWPGDGSCRPSANAVAFAGRNITRLAGWSLGRLGPIYALRYLKDHDPPRARNINYVVLYDPGTPQSDFGKCDEPGTRTVQADQTLAWWLQLSSDNRLIVMAGKLTATNHHQSIQQNYFPAVKRAGGAVRSRVLVCNYSLGHAEVWNTYAHVMSQDRLPTTQGLNSCPRQGASQVWGWNP